MTILAQAVPNSPDRVTSIIALESQLNDYESLDNHYTAAPQNGKNLMALTDTRLGVRLIYDVGMEYKYWMIFNNFGNGEFICPEPQTSLVNAPNTGLSAKETGLIVLEPEATWSATSRFHVEDLV